MSKLDREKKTYRIQKRYLEMIDEIVAYQNSLPEYVESGVKVGERNVVEEAIENYHMQIFGGKVLSNAIPQMTEILANKMDLKFDRFFENMASFLNDLLLTENINKEMLGYLIQHSGGIKDEFLEPDQGIPAFTGISDDNEPLWDILTQVILNKANNKTID